MTVEIGSQLFCSHCRISGNCILDTFRINVNVRCCSITSTYLIACVC